MPATQYRGEDLSQELALVIGDFKPTMIAVPRREDQHEDHCAAWYFLADSLNDVRRVNPEFSTDVHQLHRPLQHLAVRGGRSAARSAAGTARRRVGLDAAAADAGRDARQAPGAAPLHDADARDGLVSRRLRALQRGLLAAETVQGDPSEPAQPLLRPVDDPGIAARSTRSTSSAALSIAAMILVSTPGTWNAVYTPLDHAIWNGWTMTDLVFPFLLFAMGAAVPFALARRRGAPRNASAGTSSDGR